MELISFEVKAGSPLIEVLKGISFDYKLKFEPKEVDGDSGLRVAFCN